MIDKLQKLMAMTTSDNDGEALNAIRRANDLLAKNGKSWSDFIVERPKKKKTFYDLTTDEFMKFLAKKSKSSNLKESTYAMMIMKMATVSPDRARTTAAQFWELK